MNLESVLPLLVILLLLSALRLRLRLGLRLRNLLPSRRQVPGSWRGLAILKSCIAAMNRWTKAPINRKHSKRFALSAESGDDASAFAVRASCAPLSQGRLGFDGRVRFRGRVLGRLGSSPMGSGPSESASRLLLPAGLKRWIRAA